MVSTQHYSSKFYTHFLSKSFVILLVLVFLPYFPSQPPEFIKQTIFIKFWELIYLFVIGTVVCYGLFSRKVGKLETVTHPNSDNSTAYLSGISHVSSFFENGFGNRYVYDEKNMTQNWNLSESFVFDECKDCRSSDFQNGVGNLCVFDEKFLGQAWNSQYFVGESLVFMANGNHVVGKSDKPKLRNGYKPLNLPVRSVRSRIVDTATSSEKECGFSSSIEASNNVDQVMNFRGLVPMNLDEKFQETIVSSPIPWGSRSRRMNMGEHGGNVKVPSHSRPPSTREMELECSTSPVRSSVPTPLAADICQELITSQMKGLETKTSLRGSFPPDSQSSPATLKSKTSFGRSNRQRFSIASSSEVNVEICSENDIKDFGNIGKRDLLNTETRGVVPLNLGVEPATFVKDRYGGLSSEIKLGQILKNKFKGSKGQKEDSFCRLNKCVDASLVKGQPQIDLSCELNYEKSSGINSKGFNKIEKWDFLCSENEGNDSWNSDLNTANLVKGQLSTSEEMVEKNSENISLSFHNREIVDSLSRENKSIDSLKQDLKPGTANREIEDSLSREDKSIDSLKPDLKPGTAVKSLTRGKSVRTIRPNETYLELRKRQAFRASHIRDKNIKKCDEVEADSLKISDSRDGLQSLADERSRKNIDKFPHKNTRLRKNHNEERQKYGNSTLVKSESIFEDSEKFQVIAEENRAHIISDTYLETDEVDKKADEFIAKFREQIRLQKVASMRESKF